eukprot:COSAG03_NODE_603_length_6750_cov_10.157119_4_plen_59_part_00
MRNASRLHAGMLTPEERRNGQTIRCNKQTRWLLAAVCISLVALILFLEYQALSSYGYV